MSDNQALKEFAQETAKLLKSFARMSKGDEEVHQEFVNHATDCNEEQEETIKLLIDKLKTEFENTRRSEKSSSKSSAKNHGDDTQNKMTEKQKKIMDMLNQQKSKKEIRAELSCDHKTIKRVEEKMSTA